MKPLSLLTAAATVAGLNAACTSQTGYHVTQEVQREQCRKLLDRAERQRCEKSAAMGYDQYKAQAEAAKGTSGNPAP